MEINSKIFKAYDIRGIYPEEINKQVAFLIGVSFVKFLRQKLKKNKVRIVASRDGRISSPSLFLALKEGILKEGGYVTDLGLATSPMLYWAFYHFNFDGGVQITASHLGKEFNGFKILARRINFLSEKTGLNEIKRICQNIKIKKIKKSKGKIIKENILKDYLKFNLKDFERESFKKIKVAVDTANAVSGILIKPLGEILKIKTFHIFSKIDGNFPNHDPDPLIEKNLICLKREILKRKAHLGVAFDGDGDRIIFLDEKGERVPGDLILALLAQSLLKENKGAKILYDIRCSKVVEETIEKSGGIGVISRIGHSFIKERMRKEDILFGGEFSGHFYFKHHYFSEAPLFVFLTILKILNEQKKPFSKIILPFKKYWHSGEINFHFENPKEILKNCEKKYRTGKISKIDGLRVDFKDWWFLVRPSQTEPVLRLIVEAKTKKIFQKKKEELIKFFELRKKI